MADDDPALLRVANAIADGAVVDWRDVVQTDSSRDLIRDLKAVGEIVAWHQRNVPTSDAEPPAAWGHLQILERIGRGAFGEVYRACDTRLDRDVALKLLKRGDSPQQRDATIVEEGRLLARVRHPNVITVHGADRIADRVGVWMEFIKGRTLEEELRTRGPFDASDVTRIGIDLCRAIGAVHRAGLLHRDVKTQNVMRDDDGRIVLMDFGAGQDAIDIERGAGGVAGTPLYLAPELFRHRPASVQSDLYSVGVVLYRLSTASYPIVGRTLSDVRTAHESGQVIPLEKARPDVPRALADIVQRALAPDPKDRYQSAKAMEAALEGLVERPGRALWTRPSAGVAVSALALAMAAAGWVLWQSVRMSRDLRGAWDVGTTDAITPLGHWTAVAPMLKPRNSGLGGVTDGKWYVVGGSELPYGLPARSSEVYDPATNTWAARTPEPIVRNAAGAAVIDGKLYVVGGCIDGDCRTGLTGALSVYDPVTNAWTRRSSMPTPRSAVTVGVIDGRLYVAGGDRRPPDNRLATLEIYDPATDRWTTGAAMPVPRSGAVAGVIDGIFYVAGGVAGAARTTRLDAYDPVTNAWTPKASMLTIQAFGAGGVMNGVLYVVGGQDSNGAYLTRVTAYDPATNAWTVVAPMLTPRSAPVVGVVDDTLYAAGGSPNARTMIGSVEGFTATKPPPSLVSIAVTPRSPTISAGQRQQFTATGTFSDGSARPVTRGEGMWTKVAPMPRVHAAALGASAQRLLYVMGGNSLDTVIAYDPRADRWVHMPSMPSDRRQFETAEIDGILYVIGGWGGGSCCPNNNLWTFNPSARTWTIKAPMPLLSACGRAGVIGKKLYVLTSCDGYAGHRRFFHVYDPATNVWTKLADAPRPHVHPAAGVIDGKFYVVGGGGEPESSGVELDVYDPKTGEWSTRASMPTARRAAASGVVDGRLVVAGGSDGARALDIVEAYDPATDRWITLPRMLKARSEAAFGVIDRTLYVAGGSNGPNNLIWVEAYTPHEVVWSSDNQAIAGIDPTGLATVGGVPGRVKVSARFGSITGSTTLTVTSGSRPDR